MKSYGIIFSLVSFVLLSCYPIEDSLTGPEAGNSRVLVENSEYTGTALYTSRELAGKMFAVVRLELENEGVFEILDRHFQPGTITSNQLLYTGTLISTFSSYQPKDRVYSAVSGTLQVHEMTTDYIRGSFDFQMLDLLSSSSINPDNSIYVAGDFYAVTE